MATTVRQIIEAAYARRTANEPDKLATKAELIAVVDRLLKLIYATVAKVNRRHFATKSAPIAGVAGKWTRPADAISILWVENATGQRVHIVPFTDRNAEISPKIYPLGRDFLTNGAAGDPSATAPLTFYYAKRHPSLNPALEWDDVANVLDSTWPEHFNDILVSKVARYLAIKAGRSVDEVAYLDKEYEENLALLLAEADQGTDRISTRWETE